MGQIPTQLTFRMAIGIPILPNEFYPAGLMFWLTRNRLYGSYFLFISANLG